ncbi:hypothetical protein PENSPDRAFT_657977 [Peniophora sp. CONT]|nr:hypothetical protein PENSPDRAFT_657977 [Peniophora sp. CONT]
MMQWALNALMTVSRPLVPVETAGPDISAATFALSEQRDFCEAVEAPATSLDSIHEITGYSAVGEEVGSYVILLLLRLHGAAHVARPPWVTTPYADYACRYLVV